MPISVWAGSSLICVLQAVEVANSADVVVLAVGAAWNSDAEGGDRATLGLSPNQSQ